MTDHSQMKLGKLPFKHDPRTLLLAKYFKPEALPTPPASCGYIDKVSSWPMMLNDRLGDCTCACAGHMIQQWTAEAGSPFVPADSDILKAYEDIAHYDPATGQNDNGAYEIDVLNYWRTTGIAGHVIDGFVNVEPSSKLQVKTSVFLFGNSYIGVALPITAQSQSIWAVVSKTGDGAPGSWGGHAVPIVAYDAAGLTCVTWGQLKRMTWDFFAAYVDEAYGALSKDWVSTATGKAPNAIDYATLQADIASFTTSRRHRK